MPRYLIQFCYTQNSLSALVERPRDRTDAARKVIEGFGGKLEFFTYCFGEYDGLVLAEFPSNEAAMASVLAINAAGTVTKTHTTVLLSTEEAVKAMKRAHDTKTGYTQPG